jgi:hypothetical protein
MSSMAEESLKSFIKEFGKQGLAKIPHENVRTIATQMDGVAERLADSNVLRSESLTQYITGLTICSVAPFKAVFLNRLTELTYRDATGDVTLSGMCRADSHIIWASDCDAGLMLVALIACITVPSIIDILLQI